MSFTFRAAALLTLVLMGVVAACEWSSTSWPRTVATVEQAGWDGELNLAHRGSSEYSVRYAYQVGGQTYRGSLIRFGSGQSSMPILNAKEVRQPRNNDQVEVAYLSAYPAFSVLVPGPAPTLWIWGLVSVLVAIMFWMIGGVLKEPVI